jgi:acetyl-CoA carboxylase carboxyl transferase subunit beta
VGFAGSRVIEQTIRQTLPERFQKAEYLFDHGMIDAVVPRTELRETLGRIIRLLQNPSGEPMVPERSVISSIGDADADRADHQTVNVAE